MMVHLKMKLLRDGWKKMDPPQISASFRLSLSLSLSLLPYLPPLFSSSSLPLLCRYRVRIFSGPSRNQRRGFFWGRLHLVRSSTAACSGRGAGMWWMSLSSIWRGQTLKGVSDALRGSVRKNGFRCAFVPGARDSLKNTSWCLSSLRPKRFYVYKIIYFRCLA